MSSPSTSNLPSVSDSKQVLASTNDQSTNLDDGQITGGKTADTNESALVKKPRHKAQFTRGEKCLFIHLVVTFGILLLLFIIYVVHLYWVEHRGYNAFDGIFRMGAGIAEESNYAPVGAVYVLPHYYMCNCLLLRARWSLAPAHCVAARSDPDLADALPSWRITYGRNYEYNVNMDEKEDYVETMIIRGVAHPHFNRDDFQNNVGLFKHEDSIHVLSYATINDVSLNEDTLKNAVDLNLIAWKESWQVHGHAVQIAVEPVSLDKCKQHVSPILDLRAYEYCVTMTAKRNVSIAPGAVLATKSEYLGIFAWGDSSGRHLPFVILDLAHYKPWILHIISIYVK